MFRRRCSLIIAVDGTQDRDYALDDLGRALRMAWIDLGVQVEFKPIMFRKRADPAIAGVYAALGTIIYPENDETGRPRRGMIVYVKPGFLADAPADVRAYAAANARFPHDSTLNQFFSELQFESYRALGAHVMSRICGKPRPIKLGDLGNLVGNYLTRNQGTSEPAPRAARPDANGLRRLRRLVRANR